MQNIQQTTKIKPYSIKDAFRRERVPARRGDVIVKSTCLKCGDNFACDLRNEMIAEKETAHMASCAQRTVNLPVS